MRIIILCVLLILSSTSCQVLSVPGSLTNVASGEMLYREDFSNPSSGWNRAPDETDGFLDYVSGIYRIYVGKVYAMLWAGPGLNFKDVHVEVDITKADGPQNDNFGIVCRVVDQNNFYFLVISDDGYYGIGKVKNGVQQLIGMEAMPPSESIHQGKVTNHLEGECVGENLTLYVNGNRLSSVRDSEFSKGQVGIVAGTFGEPGTDVYFDNFMVLKP